MKAFEFLGFCLLLVLFSTPVQACTPDEAAAYIQRRVLDSAGCRVLEVGEKDQDFWANFYYPIRIECPREKYPIYNRRVYIDSKTNRCQLPF